MSFQEQHPMAMSDFALPVLKKISSAEQRTIMSEKWNQSAEREISRANERAREEWDQCMQLIEGQITDSSKIRILARMWSRIVRIITARLEYDCTAAIILTNNNNDTNLLVETLKRMDVICGILESSKYDYDEEMIIRASRSLEQLLRLNFNLPPDKAYKKYCAILQKTIRHRMGID